MGSGDVHRGAVPAVTAPDGLEVRPLARVPGASTALFRLEAGQTGRAVRHRSVAELWYVLGGSGALWRRPAMRTDAGTVVALESGLSVVIAVDTCFQVRNAGAQPLEVLGVTTPAWPGDEEAWVVAGAWRPTLRPPLPDAPELRPPRADEGPVLSALALRSKAYWGYSEGFLDACRQALTVRVDAGAVSIAVLASAEQVLGFATVVDAGEATCELDHLFVEPRFIGCGFGARLLAAARRMSAERGAAALLIQADPQAGPFYARAGARRIGVRESGSIAGRALPLFSLATAPL